MGRRHQPARCTARSSEARRCLLPRQAMESQELNDGVEAMETFLDALVRSQMAPVELAQDGVLKGKQGLYKAQSSARLTFGQ